MSWGEMSNLLTRKLESLAPLSADDKRLLDDVIKNVAEVGARRRSRRSAPDP